MLWLQIFISLFIAALAIDERGLIVVKELKRQKIALAEGVETEIIIPLAGIAPDTTKDTLSSHMILIEVQSFPSSPDYVNMEHVIDLYARMKAPGHLKEFIDIKDTFPVQQGETEAKFVYHYVIYDLCYLRNALNGSEEIELKFKSLNGEVTSNLEAKLVKFEHIKINWVDADSDWFVPREDHTSCQTWDQKVWVYGGRRNVEDNIHGMDDLMYFDSHLNRWFIAKSHSSLKPKPRYAHVAFCYFKYVIIFGGMSRNGELLGDLWVYDIVKEEWFPVIDNNNLLELQSKNIEGIIPRERAYASGIMLPVMGAAYMVGGKNNDGFACDLWALKVDKIVQYIEDQETYKLENFWVKKEFGDTNVEELCRFGHSTAEVTNHTFFIYGGINRQNKVISEPMLYNVIAQELRTLNEK